MTGYRQAETALYRLYGAEGKLLYLGITCDLEQRWKLHADNQPWWHLVTRKVIEWHPDRATAAAHEKRLTVEERPLYNRFRVNQGEANRYDDTADLRRVTEWLGKRVSEMRPGFQIWTGDAAEACGVSRVTAGTAMRRFAAEDGRLEFLLHGRYVVRPERQQAA
ncbi:GIY-YIG nuclease family protein [Streptomyces werraensis]|uniref:GIY-YIG nuclease family protein n=1 Tax=Streptomyces werraensis TaxID=68284 RepID=UPI0034381DDE